MKLKHSALTVMLVTGVCASVPVLAEEQPAVSASAETTTASAGVSAHPVASAANVASGVFTPEQEVRITERFVYAGNSAEGKALSLAGQPVSHYDTACLTQTDSVALTGVPPAECSVVGSGKTVTLRRLQQQLMDKTKLLSPAPCRWINRVSGSPR